jgi:hypothetical protein
MALVAILIFLVAMVMENFGKNSEKGKLIYLCTCE